MAEEVQVPAGKEATADAGRETADASASKEAAPAKKTEHWRRGHAVHRVHRHEHEERAKAKGASRYLPFAIAFVVYLAVALVMFYPITTHIFTNAPGTGADTYQNLWDIWWVNFAAFKLHTNVFYTNFLFWPLGTNLALATLAPLNGIIYAPFQILGLPFAYNIMFFMGFALSGLTMYLLADYLTDNSYAALVSGFIFTFSAFHIAQSYAHIHFINIEFVPLFFYFFMRVLHEKRNYFNIAGMAASFALTTLMGNIEQTIMLLVAFVLMLIIYLFYTETRKRMASVDFVFSMAIFLVLAFVIGSWNFIPLINAIRSPGGLGVVNQLNTVQANIAWSVMPAGLFIPSYANGIVFFAGVPNWIYSLVYTITPVEEVGYIGYAVLALMIYAIYKYREKMLPWAIGAIVFALLSLGPTFLLYSVYHAIPVINVVREPGRFGLIFTLFVAIIAAYGAEELFEYAARRSAADSRKTVVAALLIVLLAVMFIENNGMQLGNSPYIITNITVPKIYSQIAALPGNFSILELPTLPVGNVSPYYYPGLETFYTAITHKRLVGGYIGRQNETTSALLYDIPLTVQTAYLMANGSGYYPSPVNENYTDQTLLSLYNYNTSIVVLNKAAFTSQGLSTIENYLVGVFGSPVYNDNSTIAFQTLSAINRSVFRNYVAYPIYNDWGSTSMFVNGSYYTFWVPSYQGAVTVYAPFANSTDFNNAQSGAISYIDTTISFLATTNTPQKFYLLGRTSSNATVKIATLNITDNVHTYTVNTVLVSGPIGNGLYFVSSNGNQPVLVSDITFSELAQNSSS